MGKETTIAAITVACQEKIKDIPKFFKIDPKKLFRPKITNKKKPVTVGGKTIGSVKIVSKNQLAFLLKLRLKRAKMIPNIKTNKVASKVDFSEIKKGEISNIYLITVKPYLANKAVASSENRYSSNFLASSKCPLSFRQATG